MEDSHGDFPGRSKAVLAVTIITLVLSTAFVVFRMLSRAVIVKKIQIDDYFMMVAWIIAFGLSFAICYGCAWGLGRHEADIPTSWQPSLRKADYAFTVLYQPALMAIKTSILAFYLSISTTNRIFKWACIGTLCVVNCGGLALTMLAVFQCRLVSANFDPVSYKNATCTDIVTIYLSSAPLNIITDVAILFLPMPVLTGMRLPRKTKIILIITFSFGIFVAAVDVVRIAYLQSASMTRLAEIQNQTDQTDNLDAQYRTDFSYYAAFSFMWSVIEVNISIMCACVPGLKPLVSRFVPRMLRDSGEETSKNGSISGRMGVNELAAAQRVPSMSENVHYRDFGGNGTEPEGQQDEGPMGIMDFLTTPEMTELPQANGLERTQTALTNTSRNTTPETPTFFDFVNMSGKKSMVHHTNRESVFPISMVTILFFIWGFEYGLLDVLNQQFQRVAHMTTGQSAGIHSAYFAGYLFGPTLVGRLVLQNWGFKACYTVGLAIYASGTLIFWPAAVLTSFPAFVVTNFIVAFGLSILEVAANPFIALCGPPEWAEVRLNLSQGVQAIGSVVAPLIANRAFFHKSLNAPSLVDTQWAYLGISLATVALALFYYYVPLPEATDNELEESSERMDGANKAHFGKWSVIWITLAFGTFSQFCYVGAQEANATNFDAYLSAVAPQYNLSNYMAIAHTLFAVSRFLAAGLNIFIKPRFLLLGFFIGAIIFQALAMHYKGPTGTAMLLMVFFMEGPLFSFIFVQALRGMGRHTKIASVFITAGVSGGAVFSPICTAIVDSGRGGPYALIVPIAVFAAGTLFALLLNSHPLIWNMVDPIRDATDVRGGRDGSTSSRALSFFSPGKKKRQASDGVEHKERTNSLDQKAH
ncbi:MFS monosaccharide transporter-like protein [Acrodontium crateriforme]|uniref:MFS monosaccharide transporter-like protein n=1 Tax=Acrodontium crateriforme TaxID=150365 RepID=A0AAQ3RA93_9PEZI|nr:MFS monosaccharide transporter-like protein [Acrodontium crateriforme]